MGCSFRPDWVAGFLRMRWQLCTGLGGRNHRNTHPTPNDRIEAQDQGASGCLLVGLDDVSNFTQEGMHVFLSGLGQIRAAILPDMLSNFG